MLTEEFKKITNKNKKLVSSDNILEALPNYAFWKDKNLVYLGCNRNAAQLLGFKKPSEIVGKTDSELPWDANFIEQMNTYDQEVINTQSVKTDIDEMLVLRDGKALDVITDRTIFYDEQGEIAGILFIAIESQKRSHSQEKIKNIFSDLDTLMVDDYQPPAREQLKFKGTKVLLVEDDPLSRLVCKTFLEEFGCQVDFADCGEEALQLLKQEPKLIFMDIGLQGMSGIAVTQKIRKLEKGKTRTPIVALTAHTSEQDERQCLESGMDIFITKPISYSKIEELLEKFLNPQATP